MLFKLFVALLLTNQVLAFQQAKLEFQDLWGDPTFPISKQFNFHDFFSVKKKNNFQLVKTMNNQ